MKADIKRLYQKIMSLYDSVFSKKMECGLGDILLPKYAHADYLTLLVASRSLDVIAFMEGDNSFPYQSAISLNFNGESFDKKTATALFKKLVSSYKKNGYKKDSFLMVNRDLRILNGTHRLALNLYFNIPNVSIKVLRRNVRIESDESFFKGNLKSDFLKTIFNHYNEIEHRLVEMGSCFCCHISNYCEVDGYNVFEDIGQLARIHKTVRLSNECNADYLLYMTITDPNYILKNNRIVSQRAFEIERIINDRYNSIKLDTTISISKNCTEGNIMHKVYASKLGNQ